jgi:hypothetical protein
MKRHWLAYILALSIVQGLLIPLVVLGLSVGLIKDQPSSIFHVRYFQIPAEDFRIMESAGDKEKSYTLLHLYACYPEARLDGFERPSLLHPWTKENLKINRLSQKVVVPPPEPERMYC